jgi:hypothetical protein
VYDRRKTQKVERVKLVDQMYCFPIAVRDDERLVHDGMKSC